jgi:ketosteroid isomerase-like protein
MSQENVEIVRRSFEAFNRGGIPAVISGGFWVPSIVFDASRTAIPGVGVYRGEEEVARFFDEDWFATFPFAEWEIEVKDVVSVGDRVVATSRQRGRGATSGVGAELELANLFTLLDGKIVRIQLYRDRQEALEAAGLSE